jgi:OOP family OmpA-OmpF porin
VNRLLKLLAIALLLTSPFAAQADKGDWYVTPSLAYFDDDPDRKIDAGFSGGQIQVGKEMGEHFWLEGLLGYHDIGGFPDQQHLELGINAIGNLLPDSLFSPYVLGGIGYLRADVSTPDFGGLPPADTTANDFTGTAGLGLRIRFGDSPWSMRTEWRVRQTLGGDSLLDHIASVGFQYSFGGTDEAMPVAVAAAEEPAAEMDSDGDGVTNARDVCPNTPAGTMVNDYGCIADADRDGVADDKDECPRSTPGAEVDEYGCEPVRFRTVYFGLESAVLLPLAREKLDETIEILNRETDIEVVIAGHADSTGPDEYNMALSERRAEAVRAYLEAGGIASSRMTTRAYGESQPAYSNDTALGRADNRRVEIDAMGE